MAHCRWTIGLWIIVHLLLCSAIAIILQRGQDVTDHSSFVGRTVTFLCHTTDVAGKDPPDWTFQNARYNRSTVEPVANAGELIDRWITKATIIATLAGEYIFSIRDVKLEDAGTYRCIEEAGAGTEHTFRLNVIVASIRSSTYNATEGLTVIFPCFRSSNRTGMWQFRAHSFSRIPSEVTREGELMNGWKYTAEQQRFFRGDVSLTILNITSSSSGTYTCIVDDTKYEYILNVRRKADDTFSIATTASGHVMFICKFSNVPRVRWYRQMPYYELLYNGHRVIEQSGRFKVFTSNTSSGQSVLFINGTTPSDIGRYSCSPATTYQISHRYDLLVTADENAQQADSDTTAHVIGELLDASTPIADEVISAVNAKELATERRQATEQLTEATEMSSASTTPPLLIVTVVLAVTLTAGIVAVGLRTWTKWRRARRQADNATNQEIGLQLDPIGVRRQQSPETQALMDIAAKTTVSNRPLDDSAIATATTADLSATDTELIPSAGPSKRRLKTAAEDAIVSHTMNDSSSDQVVGVPISHGSDIGDNPEQPNIQLTLLPVITFNKATPTPTDKEIHGVCVIGDNLHVAYSQQSDIDIYDRRTMIRIGEIPVSGDQSDYPGCMAFDSDRQLLYISYFRAKTIRRIRLAGGDCKPWSVTSEPDGVAVTSRGVLVAFRNACKLAEFEPDGKLIREIHLDKSINEPRHAIPYDFDRFLICFGFSGEKCGMCLVSGEGALVKSVDSKTVHPLHIAISRNKWVFVADIDDNKVTMLDSSLTYVMDAIPKDVFSKPFRLFVDRVSEKLYVGNYYGECREFDIRTNSVV